MGDTTSATCAADKLEGFWGWDGDGEQGYWLPACPHQGPRRASVIPLVCFWFPSHKTPPLPHAVMRAWGFSLEHGIQQGWKVVLEFRHAQGSQQAVCCEVP